MRKRKLFILLVGIFLTFYICAGTTIEDFNYNNNLGKYNEKSSSSNNNPPSNSGNSTSSSYSSSSSSSSSNNNKDKDKDKDDEQPRVDPDEEEVSSISGERFLIEFIEKQNEGVEDLTVTSKVSAQDKAQAMALKRVEDKTPTVVKTNSKKIKTNEDSAKTTTSGDPVKISTGTYEQKETDLVMGTLNQFEIKRRYESDNSITGSFGYAWFSNLDQRIILGTDPNIQEEIDALKTYKNELNESINNLETDLAASYHVSSIYNAKSELNESIKKCRENIDKIPGILSHLERFKQRVPYRTELIKRADDIRVSTLSLKSSLESKLSKLQTAYNRVDQDISEINNLREKYNETSDKLKEKERLLEKKKNIHSRNSKVLFKGMGMAYEEIGFDKIIIIDDEAYPHIFIEGENEWTSSDKKKYVSCKKNEDGFSLLLRDGTVQVYNYDGFLIQIRDCNENTVTINRDVQNKILNVETSFGEKYLFEYSGSFVSKITNVRLSENTVSYFYNTDKLTRICDSDGDIVSMDYDSNQRMVQLNKCDGSFVRFDYGELGSDGSILTTTTTNEEGFAEHFEYDRSGKRTDYIDHDGNRTSYWFNENQLTEKEVHPDGSVIQNLYDDNGNLIRANENGFVTSYLYDEIGNIISAVYADGSNEFWTYDNYGRVLSYTDRDGVKDEFIRDSKGNITDYLKNGKTVYKFDYDSKGQRTRKTVYGYCPVITDYEYDSFGNLKSEKCGGIKKEYKYDGLNRVVKILNNGKVITEYKYENHKIIKKDYNGLETEFITNGRKDLVSIIQKDSLTGVIHKTRVGYDKRHLPVRVFTGDGESESLISSYIYSPEGKLRGEVLHGEESWVKLYEYKNGQISEYKQFKTNTVVESVETTAADTALQELLRSAGEKVFLQKYNYKLQNANGTIITVTDGLGINTLFEYDSYGNLIKQKDGNGESKLNRYTKAGRIIGEQSSFGGWYEYAYTDGYMISAREAQGVAERAEYYPDGSIKSESDKYGKITNYTYDERGRINCIQSETRNVWFEYDGLGRVVKKIVGHTPDEETSLYYITYDYSENGRSVKLTEGGKYKSTYELDAFGNIVKLIDGNNNERSFVYDSQNQLVKNIDGYGNAKTYEYNALGNLSRVTMPDGAQTVYFWNYLGMLERVMDDCGILYTAEYDKAGHLIKERSRGDVEKQYEYDNAGRVSKIYCAGEIIETYNYGSSGRTVTVKDGKGSNYHYKYDSFGRLISEENRNGMSQQFIYDEDGKLESKKDFCDVTTTIVYSSDRTEEIVSYSDGTKNRFVYDAIENIIEAQNANGKTVYQYDQGGRLICQKDVTAGDEIRYEYDDAGNRVCLQSSNRETFYSYGKNNEVKEIFDNKQRVRVQLTYNKNGQEVLRRFGNGTQEETLYDKAGRVTVKMQKSERGEVLWGEGYVYGEDGKRTLTVDNRGRVTIYEYNKKGQLSEVYYPFTQEHVNNLKTEAEENGLPVSADVLENRYLSSSERTSLIQLLNSMQYGLSNQLTNIQIFIKESYEYDANGNRISKIIPYGKIEYMYDRENCLISSGSNGQSFVKYTYDNSGNLLTEESISKTKKYAYNAQNRMIYCEVTDKANKEYAQTVYAYDAFGRRIIVQDKDEAALRTLYDGFTFDVIKQSPVFANGLFTDSTETGIRWGNTGRPTGDRYRYLSDSESQDGNRYFYLDENSYKTVSNRYRGERSQFSVNGSLAAQTTSSYGPEYFSTDSLGSVRLTTSSQGTPKSSASYDAFGSLVEGGFNSTSDHGYLGKQFDPTASLYNYGYRDYTPSSSRFTTVDPIRDGHNWFVYCNGDPINFIDPDGLFFYNGNGQQSYKKTTVYVIRNDDGTGNEFNSSLYIRKEDVFGNVTYSDPYVVGANCKQKYLEDGTGSTTPDGTYYLSATGTDNTPLYKQPDGTVNSTSYKNVLSLRTSDQNLTQEQRDIINVGDRLLHADEKYNIDTGETSPYNQNGTPGGAGCIINHTQNEHDEMMTEIMKGVTNPESVKVKIYSLSNMGCVK